MLDEVSARAAVRVEYVPPGLTVIAPEGGELAHKVEITRDKKKKTAPYMLGYAERLSDELYHEHLYPLRRGYSQLMGLLEGS